MKTIAARLLVLGQSTLKAYLILCAAMFFGGVLIGAGLALAGYALPQAF